jgi:WD40 repeat protein
MTPRLLLVFGLGLALAALGRAEPPIDRFGDPLPDGAVARLGTARFHRGEGYFCAALSPDGKTLAAGYADNTARLWDVSTGGERHQLGRSRPPGAATVTAVAWSPDGKRLASATRGLVQLWDPATGENVRALPDQDDSVFCLAFSPDGAVVASGARDGVVRLWDADTGKGPRLLTGHSAVVAAVAFAPDGKTLASASADRTVRLWDLATGKELRQLTGHQAGVECLAFAPDGATVATGGNAKDPTVRLWDAATGMERGRSEGHPAGVQALAFAPDGKTLVSAGPDSPVRSWDVATGKERARGESVAGKFVAQLAFAADRKTVTLAGLPPRVWDVATGAELARDAWHLGPVTWVAVSPDGKTVATGSPDRVVHLWAAGTGKPLGHWEGGAESLDGGVFGADDRTLLTAAGAAVTVWDPATAKSVLQLRGTESGTAALALAPGGRLVGWRNSSFTTRLWDLDTGKEMLRFGGGEKGTPLVAFSPDGGFVVSAATTGETGRSVVQVCAAAAGAEPRAQELGRGEKDAPPALLALTVSPDGRTVTGFHSDGSLRRWEMATGRQRQRLDVPAAQAVSAAFSADGRTGAVGTRQGEVVLVDAGTGQKAGAWAGHNGAVVSLGFSADGRLLVSGGADRTGLVRDVAGLVKPAAPRPAPLTRADLARAWGELGGDDAASAFGTIQALALDPAQGVPLIKAHLAELTGTDLARTIRLIADLDDDAFAVREKAQAELEQLGPQAEPALRKALRESLSLEVRRRVERLLAKLPADAGDGMLRAGRVLETLERAGTPEAKEVLEQLARECADDGLKQEAKASLKRLQRQAAKP